jgi:hypothetical protein
MHYDPASFAEAKDDPERLSESGAPACVAGCYRCVLSYFNQPDHEHINRHAPAALSFLLRLVHAETPDLSEKAPPNTVSGQTSAPDEKPLVVNGATFTNVWRAARLVVVEEGEANEDLINALVSKGVKMLERPSDPSGHAAFEAKLNAELKERSHGRC